MDKIKDETNRLLKKAKLTPAEVNRARVKIQMSFKSRLLNFKLKLLGLLEILGLLIELEQEKSRNAVLATDI